MIKYRNGVQISSCLGSETGIRRVGVAMKGQEDPWMVELFLPVPMSVSQFRHCTTILQDYQWGKLGKGYARSFCIMTYNYIKNLLLSKIQSLILKFILKLLFSSSGIPIKYISLLHTVLHSFLWLFFS